MTVQVKQFLGTSEKISTIDVKQLQSGVYWLRVLSPKGLSTLKFVKAI
ncbi:T9SS type A sorting domain-containing protein [Flavobacterium sp. J372]